MFQINFELFLLDYTRGFSSVQGEGALLASVAQKVCSKIIPIFSFSHWEQSHYEMK